jgi:hypothetical protein
MQQVYFTNPGEIDPRTITTMGVNVKPGDSPIGYFGTGLKYAIAVLLRNEQEVEVYSGTTKYSFSAAPQEIRGKWFNIVAMSRDGAEPRSLGFTMDLGRNWTVENAYRELHSNSLDECGEPGREGAAEPRAGHTTIVVRGGAFAKAHRDRWQFLLDPARAKLASNGAVEVYAGSAKHVFYKGIAAYALDKPSAYLYNITATMRLTEDRTLDDAWTVRHLISHALVSAAHSSILEAVFTNAEAFEANLDYYLASPSEVALDCIERIMKERPLALLDAPRKMYYDKRKKVITREEFEPTAAQREKLDSAIAFCTQIGFPIASYALHFAELGQRIVALAEAGAIWLSPRALAGDEDELATTLIEEFIHLRNRVDDATRRMQNVLFDEIVRLGRQVVAQHDAPAEWSGTRFDPPNL